MSFVMLVVNYTHPYKILSSIYAAAMLSLDLRHVSGCLKISDYLKIILRYDSFVKQL